MESQVIPWFQYDILVLYVLVGMLGFGRLMIAEKPLDGALGLAAFLGALVFAVAKAFRMFG